MERSALLAGVSRRSCNTSFVHQHEQLMEVVWILVETRRMDSLRDEAMCQVQETHRVGVFQDYTSPGLVVHDLIWDPGGNMCDCSSLDGFYYVSHRWTWDPGILLREIWVLPSNFLAGRTVMSPLWDIIIGQRFMMTRVARWMLERVQGYLRGIVKSILH